MKQTSSLASYPVFPNWVFTGELSLDDELLGKILSEFESLTKSMQHGSVTFSEQNKLGQNSYSMSRLMGAIFYDNVRSHFRLPKNLCNIESADSRFISVRPGHNLPVHINRHRWYQGAVFIKCDDAGSDIYLDMLDNKLFCSPPGVQQYRHSISPGKLKMAFWPAHIPWGMGTNNSTKDTIIFTTTFIIKRD